MKIKIPNSSRSFAGGGATFINNYKAGTVHEVVDNGEYDVLLIPGATLCDRETYKHAKDNGKPVVLRIDNILEDRKNRNSGMSRLKEFADGSDTIIYQSDWAKNLMRPYCGEGIVINNGVNTGIFKPRAKMQTGARRILYCKNSRNEVKHFDVAQYWWREYNLNRKDDTLVLAGQFAKDIQDTEHPFEMHNGEDIEYVGMTNSQEEMAKLMQSCDIAVLPYFADACSNTVLEAQACGLPVIYDTYGGTAEIVKKGKPIDFYRPDITVEQMINSNDLSEWHDEFVEEFSYVTMAKKYDAVLEFTLEI